MPDRDPPRPDDVGPPVDELEGFAVDPDAELPGRVGRSINRRLLAADAAEFSLGMLLRTAWEYLRAVLDAVVPDSQRSAGADTPEED